MTVAITLASRDDAPAIAAIYAPFVESTAVSFEFESPTSHEMAERIQKVADAQLPWLVARDGDRLLGYAYATKHKERAGYQWAVESSVYVDESARRTGVGRALYTRLFEILRELGIQNVYAGATLPNQASVEFHESFGFKEAGRYHNVGFKLGRWHDTVWMHLAIGSYPNPPATPKRLSDVI